MHALTFQETVKGDLLPIGLVPNLLQVGQVCGSTDPHSPSAPTAAADPLQVTIHHDLLADVP